MAKKTTSTDTNAQDAFQLGTQITTSLANADTAAAQRIQDLQQVHQAGVSQLARTAVALKAQYGANDPGVKAAAANLATAPLTAARIAIAQRQAATNDPQDSVNSWALHGRVFDAQLQPISGFTASWWALPRPISSSTDSLTPTLVNPSRLNYAGSMRQRRTSLARPRPPQTCSLK